MNEETQTETLPREGELYNPLDLLHVVRFFNMDANDLFNGEKSEKIKYLIDWAQTKGKKDANSILLTLQNLQTEIGGETSLHRLYESARIREVNQPIRDLSQLEQAFQSIKDKVREIKKLRPQLKQLKHYMRYL